MEYKEIKTSLEIGAVLIAKYLHEWTVFGGYSNPDGNCPLGNGQPQMDTWWGFKDSVVPMLHARHSWEKGEKDYERVNEKREYWLCFPYKECEDE